MSEIELHDIGIIAEWIAQNTIQASYKCKQL